MTLREQLESGMSHHQAGRLAEAEKLYRAVLSVNPNQPDALHLLGAVAGQSGRLDESIELISRAISLNPGQGVYHVNLSEMYRRAAKAEAAVNSAREAVRLNPKMPKPYLNMGLALVLAGKSNDAVAAFRRALEFNPEFVDALLALGNTLNSMDQHADAANVFRRLLKLKPDSFDALLGLGTALRDSGDPAGAIPILRQAITLQPQSSPAHNVLGVALGLTGRVDDAIAEFRRAIEIQPDNAVAMKNLGVALAERGQFDDAIEVLDKSIDLKPDMPESHGNLALLLLMRGDFARGFREYEWRSKVQLTLFVAPRNFPQPRWDGQPLNGKTILLHAEQGFGDTIQFVRYLPMVAQFGGRIILDCPRELVPILRSAPGVETIIPTGESLPRFDCHCPLLSLPLALNTDLNTIPAAIPYITPDRQAVEHWKSRINPDAFKVGFVWAGAAKNKLDHKRSIPFELISKLFSLNVHFFSLQKGREAPPPPPGMTFIDWTSDLHDFADTAALVAHLDLIISVDTAVAHLAGAMGKPVWMMIPFVPDWRWLLNRDDSPWYPTLRLFRQTSPGDWPNVVERVRDALQSQSTAPK
jgi:tetratricopeptide (TPR) repeat protein